MRLSPTFVSSLAALLVASACTVNVTDPAGRACDDTHPCAGGRVCRAGVCVADTPQNELDAGEGADAGVPCDMAQVGQPCTVGAGACAATGTLVCGASGLACSASAGSPSAELCDGIDNDCDEAVDESEDLVAPSCALTAGVCADAPARTCQGATGWSECSYGPLFEGAESSCDGLDNDCDGNVDDVTGCVHTFVGDGPPGFRDGTGSNARFGHLNFLTAGPDGALYLADTTNHAIRRIDLEGNVTTIAGKGRCGSKDGPIATAELCDPADIAFGPGGVLYFSEWSGNKLRKIENGTVTTLAGAGWGSNDGDGLTQARFRAAAGIFVEPSGDVLIADYGNHRIRRYVVSTGQVQTVAGTTSGNADGAWTAMQMDDPIDVVADSAGTLYVAEMGGDRIRKLPVGGTSSTLAGSPSGGDAYVEAVGTAARFDDPHQLLLDEAAGLLYVADANNYRVRAVPLNGTSSTYPVVGGSGWGVAIGPASEAQFKYLVGVARIGNYWYLSDYEGFGLRRVASASNFPSTVVEHFVGVEPGVVRDGPGASALLEYPDGLIRLDDGRLLWVEWRTSLLRELSTAGTVTTLVGDVNDPVMTFANGPLAQARMDDPHDLVRGPDGALYIAEGWLSGVRKVDLTTGMVSSFAGPQTSQASGDADGTLTQARFRHPVALTFGKAPGGADILYVADEGNALVRRIPFPQGPVTTLAGNSGMRGLVDGLGSAARFSGPETLAADDQGNVYVGDDVALRKIDAAGNVTTLNPNLGFHPRDMEWDGNILVIVGGQQVVRYDPVTGVVVPVLQSSWGFKDGRDAMSEALEYFSVVVTPEAYLLTDLNGATIRRLWR